MPPRRRNQQNNAQPPLIELETLLHGEPTLEQVREFFRRGEFHEEHYSVAAIKRHLLTNEQKNLMVIHDLSIEDMLNGRVAGEERNAIVAGFYRVWNARLGFAHFGWIDQNTAIAQRPSAEEIVKEAMRWAEEKRKQGWTKADFAAGLKRMLESPTGDDSPLQGGGGNG
jgi:hypothetical protein